MLSVILLDKQKKNFKSVIWNMSLSFHHQQWKLIFLFIIYKHPIIKKHFPARDNFSVFFLQTLTWSDMTTKAPWISSFHFHFEFDEQKTFSFFILTALEKMLISAEKKPRGIFRSKGKWWRKGHVKVFRNMTANCVFPYLWNFHQTLKSKR